MRGKRASKPVRLNLELDQPTKRRLDRLKSNTEAASLTEVIRRALQLYEVVQQHVSGGGQVVLRMDEDETEVVFL